MEKNKKIIILMLVVIFMQLLLSGVIMFKVIDQDNKIETYTIILKDFTDGMKLTDKKLVETMNAHNREVESWYVGNKYIDETTNLFFDKMRIWSDDGNLTEFETCIEDYEDYYTLLVPHINADSYVEGYAMQMYSIEEFSPIGYMIFTKEYTEYVIYTCGGYKYNKITDEMIDLKNEF